MYKNSRKKPERPADKAAPSTPEMREQIAALTKACQERCQKIASSSGNRRPAPDTRKNCQDVCGTLAATLGTRAPGLWQEPGKMLERGIKHLLQETEQGKPSNGRS